MSSPNPQDFADQYNLEGPPPVPTPPTAEPSPPAAPQPPRGADGKFLPKHNHPDRLVRMAKDLGFSEEEIHTSQTAELRAAVNDATMERLSQWRADTIERARTQEPPSAPPTPEPTPTVPELNWDDYDDGLVKFMKGLLAELKALRTSHDEIRGHVQAEVNRTVTQQVDAEFNKRPDLFGKGNYGEIPEDSAENARRVAVANYVRERMQSDKGTWGQKVAKAISVLYPDSKPAKQPKPDEDEVARWNEGALAIPTQRAGAAEPHGRDRAIKAVRDQMRENGLQTQPTALDDFPE